MATTTTMAAPISEPVKDELAFSKWKIVSYHAVLWVPLSILIGMILLCFAGPFVFSAPGPNAGNILVANHPIFSNGHILGTDPSGNDVASRILYGGRISIEVGLGSVLIGLIIGATLGAGSALKGGIVDQIIPRLFDMLLSFPALILTLVVAENLGPSESHVIFAIAYFQVPAVGRLARANTLRLRELEFISVAKLSGTSDFMILLRHIAPNIIPQLMTFAFLGVSIAIIVEASLSFLGFGVPPPNPSWGNMIALGQQYLATEPALIFVPAAFLFVTVASLNMVGDALRLRWVQA